MLLEQIPTYFEPYWSIIRDCLYKTFTKQYFDLLCMLKNRWGYSVQTDYVVNRIVAE